MMQEILIFWLLIHYCLKIGVYYRPPEGGRLLDMKVVSSYVKKPDSLRKGGDSRVWLHETWLSRDANTYKRIETFRVHFE